MTPSTSEPTVAMVVGGGRNIGRQIALTLAEHGHAVAVVVRERLDEAEQVVAEIRGSGGAAAAYAADVASSAEIGRAVQATVDDFGRIDVLVNCAAIRTYVSLLDLTDESWERALGVNLSGPLYAARAALPHMVRQGGGAVINISGLAALMGGSNLGICMATTKAGLHGLAHSIASEFGPHGVRANSVILSRIENAADEVSPERLQLELSGIPLRRIGTMHEVADLCAYLASPSSSYLTGQSIHLNGGKYMA
ncbi:SDR family NAD(P)-dependent oxidoreductase [Nocardioides sp.]|uniref:SDR family NAD(P)-dependent oxidoreductase n=1 Tax=Nocardioides sp. TaxID=35761 RepID=UPI003D0A6B83